MEMRKYQRFLFCWSSCNIYMGCNFFPFNILIGILRPLAVGLMHLTQIKERDYSLECVTSYAAHYQAPC